jgi:hypothetical protein
VLVLSVSDSKHGLQGLTQDFGVYTSDVRNLRNFHWSVAALGQHSEHTRVVASGDGGMATRLVAVGQQLSPFWEVRLRVPAPSSV